MSTAVAERPAGTSTPRGESAFRRIVSGNGMVTLLAVLLSLIISAVLIVLTDEDVQESAGYLLARPADALRAAWEAVSGAYAALFRGSILNYRADTAADMFRPLTETLTVATPLIIVSLGVAIAFRAGLFNIGAQGQFIFGAMFATWFGVHLDLPFGVHLLLVMAMAILGGVLWGGVVGVLKAWTGAHEVILTIMLNYVAVNLLAYLLNTPVLRRAGTTNPVSDFLPATAMFPKLLGDGFRLHAGFLVALLATAFAWWLMSRSTLGFRLRAVGANPDAARTAGMSVKGTYVAAMALSGGLAGLAGMAHVSGTEGSLNTSVAGSFGFDAITVALLGRSHPVGVLFAGLLFGALRAGGVTMQTETGVPIDIVLVVQSMIVLFIAAPPLVRAIFRLPAPGAARARRSADPVTQSAVAGAAVTGAAGQSATPSAQTQDAAVSASAADAPAEQDGDPHREKGQAL
ncbi:ABC transporter permease [Micrococcus flavus]|uniref:Simple sugar transport system permease protein n=1 Tax=Micrococcus flavus TaxID=384602 RepID=A0A4Y8X1L5_9MICC|nr:ABC transporter permease [Micrococcus flavus]MBB4883351.1 simple sugar transport system permease protein [Micrococcus flavus]TFI02805.1 ABC transporter permease [Micrococcus flavus]GGK44360.1 ABC transporter permease [Micrococcus flavus]